jgi:hypothetical protein
MVLCCWCSDATVGWTVWGPIPCRAKRFGPPSLHKMGSMGYFPGGKAAGMEVQYSAACGVEI